MKIVGSTLKWSGIATESILYVSCTWPCGQIFSVTAFIIGYIRAIEAVGFPFQTKSIRGFVDSWLHNVAGQSKRYRIEFHVTFFFRTIYYVKLQFTLRLALWPRFYRYIEFVHLHRAICNVSEMDATDVNGDGMLVFKVVSDTLTSLALCVRARSIPKVIEFVFIFFYVRLSPPKWIGCDVPCWSVRHRRAR